MNWVMTQDGFAGFDRLARPLLELVQHLTGLETSFVSQIDWDAQQQKILFALNTAELRVTEGTVAEWSDSTCRLAFLSNKEYSSDVPTDFPGSRASEKMGMRTFFGLPILNGDTTLGTLCGASRRSIQLDDDTLANIRLIAQALSFQLASHLDNQALRGRAERADALALIDPLTGLANRRAFTSRFEEELARSARHDSPIAVLAIDLDHFKAINDTYGHPGGDRVLVTVADVLRAAARTEDIPARLGGDEFALLLPHCDDAGAETVADRIDQDFCQAAGRLDMPCTLSIGISTSQTSPRLSLLAAADKALYHSKTNRPSRTAASTVCA